MRKNGGKKIKDLNLFEAKDIKITGNRVAPHNEFIEFKKQDIHRSIAGYFESQVRKYPQNTAIKTKTQELTYRQLNEKSNRVARAILNLCGQEPGGALLLFEHETDMIVGILSALKAGKFYIPLEHTNPVGRLLYIVEDTNAKILITNNKNIQIARELINKAANQIKLINISTPDPGISAENPGLRIDPQSPAYILYTSGSTGKPKGVIQVYKNVLHHARVYINNLHINANDRLTLFSSYGFDAAVMDIFGALLSGAALYILSVMDEGNLESLPGWLREERITIYHSVPTLYRYFMNILESSDTGEGTVGETFPHLRFIVLGGGVVYKRDVERYKKYFSRDCLFINGLGPTESTVTLQYFIDKQTAIDWESVPVGFPVDETSVPLLDENNRETQIYSTGEIVYKSDYLALGYTNMPEKTAEVFVTDPLTGHGRVFRSGDFGRLLGDGNIEFLGRIDRQVKIRGFRVDLGEIESRLLGHKEVKETVVINFESEQGESYLCAYIVPAAPFDKIPGNDDLKEYLSGTLPDYMIPSSFTILDNIPFTPRGKIDRKALPAPGIKAGKRYIALANKTQEKLAAIWAEVLGIDKDIISIDSNFFQLGGHSLKATLLISRIYKEADVQIPLVELFKTPTIMELAEYMHRTAPGKFVSLQPLEKKEYYALSPAQQRLYVLHRFEVKSTAYNLPNILSLEQNINKDTLEETFKKLISRHESLRTSFIIVGNEPVQVIHDEVEFKIEYDDLQVTGAGDRCRWEVVPATALISSFIRPFDLSRAPLLRVGLIKEEEKKYILAIDIHHIITDGLSQQILIRDFISLYAGQQLPPLRVLYKEYSQWQQSKEVQNRLAKQEESWLKEFREQVPVLVLPTDYPRPALQSFEGNITDFTLKAEETGRLDEIAHSGGATLFMVILAIYNIFLLKISNQEDIVVGTPIAGRRHADLEKVVGMFVNTLALRNYPTGEKTFNTLLKEIKEKTIKAFENQDYQFEDMVEKIVVERDMSRNPLFDVMFMFQDLSAAPGSEGIPGEEIKDLKIKSYQYELRVSKFDLSLIGVKRGEKLYFTFEYCTKLFKQETIERFIKYFLKIVSAVTANPETKISGIEIISGEEKRQLLYDFNDTAVQYPEEKTIHRLFAEQVERTPNQTVLVGKLQNTNYKLQTKYKLQITNYKKNGALGEDFDSCSEGHLSYKELNEKSGQLAHLLIEKGVQADTIVGIMVERSVEMIIVILGILKASGAYLPIDPGFPEERINYMLADSSTRFLVTTPGLLEKFEKLSIVNCQLLMVNEKPPNCRRINTPPKEVNSINNYQLTIDNLQLEGSNLAYVIYTSGSTGKPKGVMLEHRSVINFIIGITSIIPFTKDDRILSLTTISFDIFGLETLVPLTRGPVVVIGSKEEQMDASAAARVMEREHICILQVTPSRLRLLKENNKSREALKRLTHLLVGGEAFPALLLERVREIPVRRIFNLYGPTETTIWSTVKDVSAKEALNIGKPIANTGIYILSKDGGLQPIGVPGELYISGHGLARGYVNQPELTAEKFDRDLWDSQDYQDKRKKVPGKNHEDHMQSCKHASMRYQSHSLQYPIPPSPHSPIYRTGDLARWLSDGNIEYLQRIDHQVKIRGYRIELEEIENRLSAHHEIKETVVMSKTNEMGDAYLCAYFISDREIHISDLRKYLSAYLPDYMMPSYFVKLDKISLNQNGKIDRKALPEPEAISLRDAVEYVPPTNDIEKKLVEIWEKVLGRDQIGINENFFLIGGDSIKSIQIISRMNNAGYQLEMNQLFKHPVIADLAPHVKKIKRLPDQSVITGTIPLTPIQARYFDQSHVDSHHYNQAVMFYSPEGFDKKVMKEVFTKIREHHDALRITYRLDAENKEVLQINHGLDYPLSLQEYDLKNRENSLEELKTKINEIQAGIDLEKGPLMKLGLFHLDDGDRLLIVIHHLVIDGVSWRILFEDIESLYAGYKKAEKPTLPAKTDSYKLWSEKLSLYADSQTLLEERTYWARLESHKFPGIKKDFEVKENHVKDDSSLSFTLEEEETTLLLTKVNRVYQTEINDILLTALALAIKETFGQDRVLLALEGHGREEILEDMDTSRTVGWFTSIYPVVLDVSYADNPGRQLKEIKETLRRVPNKGIGYGILKYLTHEKNKKEMEFKLNPQIIFNYLGQFDADVKQLSFFEIARESTGHSKSLKNRREYELDVSGMITNQGLTMTFSYNETHFKRETMAAFANHFQSQLKQIIVFCSSKKNIELTPSDFTYKGLSIESIDRLMELYPDLEDLYPLTPMQEGMLFHTLVDASSSYFQQMSYRLQGELDIHLVEKSLNQLFKRHHILRTAFVYKDIQRPVQVVLRHRTIDFHYQDIGKTRKKEEKENFIKEFKENDKKRSFDLSRDVLMRVSVLHTGQGEYEFTWSFHHILMDGWCLGILNTEFFEIYNCYLQDRPYRLPKIKPYGTYIQWLEKKDKEGSARYWQQYLDSFEEQTGIPQTKLIKKKEKGYRNEQVSMVLNREKSSGLIKLAAGNHVTLNTVVQAVWGILLGKYNGKEDVVFGAVVSGRPFELEGVESMVGLFINAIPVRIRFEEKKFHQLLENVQEQAIASEPHHYHPLAEIQAGTPLKQNLLDHVLIFENYPIAQQIEGYGKEQITGKQLSLKVTNVEAFEQTNYDFNVIISGTDQLTVTFPYNGNVYDRDEVNQLARRFLLLIHQVLENEKIEIQELTLLSVEEKNRILNQFNNTEKENPKGKTIHGLFTEQVEKSPDIIAVIGMDRGARCAITYRELNEKSNRLAVLLQEKGLIPGMIVGLMIHRSLEMIVGILGILKSGGAYLPIEPEFPEERINYMLKDSGAKILLTSHEIVNSFGICNLEFGISPRQGGQLAYIIYTSGSTGRPKGVMVDHRGIFNTLYWRRQEFKMRSGDRVLHLLSFGSDAFITSFFTPVISGALAVQLSSDEVKDIILLKELIVSLGVTYFLCVPSLYRSILEMSTAKELSGLKVVLMGGEPVLPEIVEKSKQLNPGLELVNDYGPTETSVVASICRDIRPGEVISIGKPIPNVRIYIMDKYQNLVSIGIPGELVIAGKGLARGYLNQPELTGEKFINYKLQNTKYKQIPNYNVQNYKPNSIRASMQSCNHASMQYQSQSPHYPITPLPHYPIYKTGDLARWLPDGNIEFLGRIDSQVKVRGFRIELGEIENRILMYDGIKEVVAVVREDQTKGNYVCAYFVSEGEVDIPRIRGYLSGRLPGPMIPAYFVRLDSFPLTPSGKVDRRALPEPGITAVGTYIAPRNEVEEKLVEIWSEILGIEKELISVESDFFRLGGHSLTATRAAARIYKEFEIKTSPAEIFKSPTIAEIAPLIEFIKWGGQKTTGENEKREEVLI